MIEQDWLACTDPTPMLELVREKASDRKLRLFAVACCRVFWATPPLDAIRRAIETNELFADLQASDQELSKVRSSAHSAAWDTRFGIESVPITSDSKIVSQRIVERTNVSTEYLKRLYFVAFMANPTARLRTDEMPMLRTDSILALTSPNILRDVFGNPWRPITIDPTWLVWNDATVLKIARGIYDERAFDLLPILADALEEAGCNNSDILAHCRSGGLHVRGCWPVDLVLSKN
jgi:hypothetical protein